MDLIKCQHPLSADCSKANTKDVLVKVNPLYLQKIICQELFKCFCETICVRTKRLNIRGFLVQEKLGRKLRDLDVPALLIFLSHHQEITHLSMAGNDFTDSGFINLVDYIVQNRHIEELDIQNNNIMKYGIHHLLEVGKQFELKSLNLKGNKLDTEACKDLALFLLDNKYMQNLNIADGDQTTSSLIYFMMVLSSDQKKFNATLKKLNISRPSPGCMYFFDSAHFADIVGHMLKHNTTLTSLCLRKYNFSCHDIESMMFNAMYNNSLQLLDLGCNNIGDHGIDHICKWLIMRPLLRILILCRNIITDHGARSLSFALPSSKLLSLDISYNKITDNGMVSIFHTLKKTPLLRQLKIFGNCIGHPVAKVVKRMLISKVLNQESIDVKPYRVDHRWYFARYQGKYCKNKYEDIPYSISVRAPVTPAPSRASKKYYKYTYSTSTEFMFKHSIMTMISKSLGDEHINECKCCFCLKCEAPHYDEECRKSKHSDSCLCCKCKGDESSDWTVDESLLTRIEFPCDIMKNIEHILNRVNSETKQNILKWLNMDNPILKEELDLTGDSNTSDDKSENTAHCNCSWKQINISSLQKYLRECTLRNILIIPNDYNASCKAHTDGSGSTECCINDI